MAIPGFFGAGQKFQLTIASDLEMAGGGAGRSAAILPVVVDKQEKDNWCWAAVAVAVARFYDPDTEWTQWAVAEIHLGFDSCCGPSDTSTQCDVQRRLDEVLTMTGNLVEYVWSPDDGTGPGLPFATIQLQIDNGRVIATRVGWYPPEGGGHFQIINGWRVGSSGDPYIEVGDSIFGPETVAFEDFARKYAAKGYWNLSYFTKPNDNVG